MRAAYHADPRPDVQALLPARVRRCLDVGCGAGALSAAIKHRGADHVAGIERDHEAAAIARTRLDVVVEGSVVDCPLPFEPGEFDLLVFADVLEHLADPDAALERCLRLLAPGGAVIVRVPNMRFYLVLLRLIADRWEYTDAAVRDRTHLRVFTHRSLERMPPGTACASSGWSGTSAARRPVGDRPHGGAGDPSGQRHPGPVALRDLMAYQYATVARRA